VSLTHHPPDALALPDRDDVKPQRRSEQGGSADDSADRPATPFVFDFIGDSSALSVKVDRGRIRLDDRVLALEARGHADGPATLFFRPNHIRLADQEGGAVVGTVTGSRRVGDIRRLELETGQGRTRIEVDVPADANIPKTGRMAVHPTNWRLFPAAV
jgi:sulfate transport system ATP-binding protein